MIKVFKVRNFVLEYLSNFLIGEGRLERYLDEHPPQEATMHIAKIGLIEAKRSLQLAANEKGKEVILNHIFDNNNRLIDFLSQAGVALDAHLLLGKLHFACGQYRESLNNFKMAELGALSEKRLPM